MQEDSVLSFVYGLLVTLASLPPVRQSAGIAYVVRDIMFATSTLWKYCHFAYISHIFLLGCITKYFYIKNRAMHTQHTSTFLLQRIDVQIHFQFAYSSVISMHKVPFYLLETYPRKPEQSVEVEHAPSRA